MELIVKNDNRYYNQHPAHGWRSRLFLMGCRAFLSNVLPNLKLAQLADNCWTYDHSHEQRSKAGKGCAESDVAEDAEWRKQRVQLLIQEPIKQSSSGLISA